MTMPDPFRNVLGDWERLRREREEYESIFAPPPVRGPMVTGRPAPGGRVGVEDYAANVAAADFQPIEIDPNESSGFWDRSLRMVTSALSPLQLPQDVLFATLAGAMDRNKSVMDYLGEMEWAHYTPWTPAPVRNVSGEQLLTMGNVRDGTARKIVGFGLDLFADPLMGGLLLRGVGMAAKGLGASASTVNALNKTANIVDTASESMMLAGGLPTVRVAQAARQIPGFRQIENAVVDNFVKKYAVPAMEPLLQATLTLPVSGRKVSLGGMFLVDAGRMEGAQRVVARAGATAEETAENTAVLLMQADAAAGGTAWKRMLTEHQRSMAVMYDIPINEINKLPQEMSSALMASAGSTANDLGYVTLRARGARRLGESVPSPSPEMQGALREIDRLEDVMIGARMRSGQADEFASRANFYDNERQRLMTMATRYGEDAEKVGNIFDNVVHRFAQVGALEGYFASGYGPMREKFFHTMASRLSSMMSSNPQVASAIKRAGGEANVIGKAWNDLLRSGPQGYAKEALDYNVRFAGADLAGDAGKFTYRDMFGDYNKIGGLDIGDYIDSLTRGHMRRTFGMFQDENSWRVAVERVKDGKIASSRILNEPVVYNGVKAAGFQREADLLKTYLDDIVPKTYGGRPTGAFVRQEDVLQHMVNQGVSPARAEEFWRSAHRAQDGEVAALADRIADYGRARVTTPDAGEVLGARRKNVSQPELETLIELMDPLLSRAETSVAATSAARRMEGVTGVLKLAEKQGLILDTSSSAASSAPRWWKNIKGQEAEALPMLAHKTVHPMVYREIFNLVSARQNPQGFLGGLQRVRSMLSAGFLANPATTTANIAGGFWTAMEYGINPVKLMSNMFEVHRDLKRMGRELPEFAHTRDILEGGVSSMDILRQARDLPSSIGSDLRSGIQVFGDAMRGAAKSYENFLKKPFGSPALGLGMFSATESLFRLGTFRMVMKETGGNIEEARRAARFVVFDYASQPGAVQLARDSGLFMFPAFPYFMVGRTVKAATERPGMLAAAERLPEVVSKMVVPDENQRSSMLLGFEDWMRDDKYIPIRRKDNGDVSVLSLNQLIPTNTLTGAPFADSLKTAGLWGPLVDMITASLQLGEEGRGDPGRGAFTGRFGRRVLPVGVDSATDPAAVLKGFGSFFYNSFAPGIARKLVRAPEDPSQQWEGIVPQLARAATTVPAEWGYTGRTTREVMTGRADQDFLDATLSFSVRSTRNVITEGPLAAGPQLLQRAQAELQRELGQVDYRIRLLTAEGKIEAARDVMENRNRLIQRYWDRWGDQINEVTRLAQAGQFNVPR